MMLKRECQGQKKWIQELEKMFSEKEIYDDNPLIELKKWNSLQCSDKNYVWSYLKNVTNFLKEMNIRNIKNSLQYFY